MTADVIQVGTYIVIKKQNYKKLYKFNKTDGSLSLGRDNVNLSGIEGCPFFSVFRMIPEGGKRKGGFRLELANEAVDLKDEIDIKVSGVDNRNILDDGKSQKLSAAEIAELASDAAKPADIVETLISNSNTFHNKTEFAQEKYLNKKQKKYSQYIQILKPNLRLIAEIMYKLEANKIQNLRLDTLSQILTMSNIHCEGVHLLYDSGSNGLLAAALLSCIGANTNGKLLHMHPGNMSQKQALVAMNFSEEQNQRCLSVNIYSALRQYYQGCDTHEKINENESNTLKRKTDDNEDGDIPHKLVKLSQENGCPEVADTSDKKNHSEPKVPKWHFDNIAASELLTQKVDSLVIACKEDPLNIFLELLQFVKPGRPFVVYYNVAEPLQNMYVELKPNPRVAALKLTCNWMRNYQVLPDRTHPDVMMNNDSGYLLSGYILK